jgi:hypothetical protein
MGTGGCTEASPDGNAKMDENEIVDGKPLEDCAERARVEEMNQWPASSLAYCPRCFPFRNMGSMTHEAGTVLSGSRTQAVQTTRAELAMIRADPGPM